MPSPTTGMRLKPLRSASDIAWRSVLCRSMNTTSVRGTMTSRTIVSPSSKTEWIITRSRSSMSWFSSREVDQVAQLGLGRERSLAEALAGSERVADQDQQLRQRTEHPGQRVHERGPLSSATGAGCWRPSVRGETPIAM